MSLTFIFALLVIAGFGFRFAATLRGAPPWCSSVAWGLWLLASIIWAWPVLGAG